MSDVVPTLILDGQAVFAIQDDVSITLANVARWTIPLVDAYMDGCVALSQGARTVASVSHFLGEVPTAAARKRMHEIMKQQKLPQAPRIVLLTDSVMMRGAATAWAWLSGSDTQAFAPADLRAAVKWATSGTKARAERVEEAALECYRLIGAPSPLAKR